MTDLPRSLEESFEVVGRLGRGSFGEVLEVRQPGRAGTLALKMIPVQGDGQRELRELKASQVMHRHLIRCHATGVEDGVAWLLLEKAEGSLEDAIGRPERMEDCWRWLGEAARGVAALHHQGLVHRDLKPSNILLTPEGAKVSDLGLTKGRDLRTVTRAGMVLGTPGYLSPEQARGEKLTPASDVFAMGVMYYQVVEGRLPYPEDTAIGLVSRVSRGEVHAFDRARDLLPAEVLSLLERALEPDPSARPGDLAAWAEKLGPFCQREATGSRTRLRSTEDVSRSRQARALAPRTVSLAASAVESDSRRPARATGGAVVRGLVAFLGLLGTGYFLLGGDATPAQVRWRTVGNTLLVDFRSDAPEQVELRVDGEEARPLRGTEGSAHRLRLPGLPPGRELSVRLVWPGGSGAPVPITPDRPAVRDRVRVAAERRLLVEVLRDCRVRWDGEPLDAARDLEPGRVELSLPGGRGPWTLRWEEEGLPFSATWTLLGLAEETIQRLDDTLGGVDVDRIATDRLMKTMIQALERRVEREHWGKDPLAEERKLWEELRGWLPALLASDAPRAARLRLQELWQRWSVYFHLERDLVGVPHPLSIPPGEPGSQFEGLPPWPEAREVPLPLGEDEAVMDDLRDLLYRPLRTHTRFHFYSLMRAVHDEGRSDEDAPAELRVQWPAREVPDRARVAFCLRALMPRWYRYRITQEGADPPFTIQLSGEDLSIPRPPDGADRWKNERAQRHAWRSPEPVWLTYVLPADLWPRPGAELVIELGTILAAWPTTSRVYECKLLVAPEP